MHQIKNFPYSYLYGKSQLQNIIQSFPYLYTKHKDNKTRTVPHLIRIKYNNKKRYMWTNIPNDAIKTNNNLREHHHTHTHTIAPPDIPKKEIRYIFDVARDNKNAHTRRERVHFSFIITKFRARAFLYTYLITIVCVFRLGGECAVRPIHLILHDTHKDRVTR